jgi:hypothetical protein
VDVVDSPVAANLTRLYFKLMWQESLANKTGMFLRDGFQADRGALCINAANHREMHQMVGAGWRLGAGWVGRGGVKGWGNAGCRWAVSPSTAQDSARCKPQALKHNAHACARAHVPTRAQVTSLTAPPSPGSAHPAAPPSTSTRACGARRRSRRACEE